MTRAYDVVVVGGGAAGLSGGLTLARARRSVVVIDAGQPRNRNAQGVHSFLTRDGVAPAELMSTGADEVRRYGGEVVAGTVTSARRKGSRLEVLTAEGDAYECRRLLVTTGVVDELPSLPGVEELWGRDVLHCPYCHGWEMRDRSIGVLGRGSSSVHQALLFRQWSSDLTFFQHLLDLSDDEREQLAAFGVDVVEGEVERLVVRDGRLAAVALVDGTLVPQEAVVVATKLTVQSPLLESLGIEASVQEADGHVVGSVVDADPDGFTGVPGVWVAGNVADLSAQVISAAAGGLRAAAAINADLVDEDVELAVAERRQSSA
jgi:thioredoxin reductase